MEKITRKDVLGITDIDVTKELSSKTEEIFKIGNTKRINKDIQTIPCNPDDVSDGYHTFGELYHHRALLTASLMRYINFINKTSPTIVNRNYVVGCWKSKQHDDGSMYPGFFIVGFSFLNHNTKKIEYATYHYELEYWNLFSCNEIEKAPLFDGHDSDDAISRIYNYIKLLCE